MTGPEYATFRDLVEVVEKVDEKLDAHKLDTERRLGRIEKGLLFVGLIAVLHPALPHDFQALSGAVIHALPFH